MQAAGALLHGATGGDSAVTRWFFGNALARGMRFEAIGLSYYPLWHGTLDDLRVCLRMAGEAFAPFSRAPWPQNHGFCPL